MDPLTTDQWALWPSSAVTLATLSMTLLRFVGMMEYGVGQIQCVSVSGMECGHSFFEYTLFSTGICFDLPSLTNGMISYNDAGYTNRRPVDTVAIFSCDTGYTLNEDATKICGNDGMWSGSSPTCEGHNY